ncbi:hypothetical protein ACH5RR_026566 [Cinchona calisaya]|uniref:Uncharacterized protein n=1 Tax=Cinchona calisaya TaxID=153742 RepID=A0ABD2Z502_9GENT
MRRHNIGAHLIIGIANGPGSVTLSSTWWRNNRYSALMFRPQVSKKVTNNPALKKSSAKKRLLEPTEKKVDDLFLSKFYERLDRFTKDLSMDFIRSGKTIDPRQSKGMRSSLVEDGLIHSVEFSANESSSQHGPTTFGSLDDIESFMSSLPSTKDIHNLFDNGVFVKGSGFLQTKRTKNEKRFPSCGIHDEPRPSTPLRDLSRTNENLVRGKKVISENVDKISSKGEDIFHLEDKTHDELFDYTPLNDGTQIQ